MEWLAVVIGLLYFFGGIAVLFLLIYFLMKRLEDRKKEKFEKRSN